MVKGLVFGKFYPFHAGHQALIEFASQRCDHLTVLICASDNELLSGAVRAEWIRETYRSRESIQVVCFEYSERHLANTSVPSLDVSRAWAEVFINLVPDISIVFTSEPYGEMVAVAMGVKHVLFDPDRLLQPISATVVREGIIKHWHFLPRAVQHHFQRKVAVLGTESTGKTTLSKQLAKTFYGQWVEEAARTIIPNSVLITEPLLMQVAEAHAKKILDAQETLRPIVVCDTDVYITQSYRHFTAGQWLELQEHIVAANAVHLRLYLDATVPFVQDGTRLSKADRNALDESHRQTLKHFGCCYLEIRGQWPERRLAAEVAIKNLFSWPHIVGKQVTPQC